MMLQFTWHKNCKLLQTNEFNFIVHNEDLRGERAGQSHDGLLPILSISTSIKIPSADRFDLTFSKQTTFNSYIDDAATILKLLCERDG